MQYLSVPNFEKWQHYKDRTPPWIKLHRDLLRDYDFSLLPDPAKAHLILIWLLASQLDNRIPDDPAYVQRMTGSATKPDLNLLKKLGFLGCVALCEQDASNPIATCTTLSPIREAETEAEAETKTDLSVSSRYSTAFEYFWKVYPKNNGSKKEAADAYQRATKKGIDHEVIIRGTERYARYIASRDDGARFTKHASSWLNGQFWEADWQPIAAAGIGGQPHQPRKSRWETEGNRLVAKYLSEEAQCGGQGPAGGGDDEGLRLAEAVRQVGGGTGDVGGRLLLGAGGLHDADHP